MQLDRSHSLELPQVDNRSLEQLQPALTEKYFGGVANTISGIWSSWWGIGFAALFILGIVLVFASAGIYLVEQAAQPEAFGSIPAALSHPSWMISRSRFVCFAFTAPTLLMAFS